MDLAERIREHETACRKRTSAAFEVVEIRRLADGVLAVRDAENEFTIYIDLRLISFLENSSSASYYTDHYIPSLPEDTGLVVDVMAKSWRAILATGERNLIRVDGRTIRWLKRPVTIAY